jgi:insulysin
MIQINKPKFDKRKIIGGQLTNGVKYILINDQHLDRSYVSVSLNVGSYSNPIGYDGLAHFLEHMLFMGSVKYPSENHYQNRLNELGGSSNAYTDTTETVYYFNVFNSGLAEIFDIFSRFFIDPLFDSDSIDRELNAVNSEHLKNINKDHWKKFQLMLYLTNKSSCTNTFITGSLHTLRKPDIRNKVIEFYNKYYGPGNISICIGSSKPIDSMYSIISTTFGNIKNKLSNPVEIIKPFYNENYGKSFHLKSQANIYEITIIWEIPYQTLNNSKDFTVLSLLLTNKSNTSMYFYLKNLGWINSIDVEIKREGVFSIDLGLTKIGFDNIDLIESIIYTNIQHYINSDLKSYGKYYQSISHLNYDCLQKLDTEVLCNLLSVKHHYVDTHDVFDSSFTIKTVKSTQYYQELFRQWIKPTSSIKIIQSQTMPNAKLFEYKVVKEYLSDYAEIINLDKNRLFNSHDYNKICCFSPINNYLDMKPSIVYGLDKYNVPILIGDKQWYGGCSKFCEPLVNVWLQLNSNQYFNSPTTYLLTIISCSVLNFMARVTLFKPLEVGYSVIFEAKPSLSTININITALNDIDKLKQFIEEVGAFLFNIDVIFSTIKSTYIDNLIISFKESYLNTNFLNCWDYLAFMTRSQIYSTEYSIDELIGVFDLINYHEIKLHLTNLLTGVAATSLIYGNIQIDKFTFGLFDKLFKTPCYPLPTINNFKGLKLKHPNPNEKSHCVNYYYPIGKFVPVQWILLILTTNILSQPFFDQLRTKQQLGYLVQMSWTNVRDSLFIVQKIQSDKSISVIQDKISEFNESIEQIITNTDFKQFIKSLKRQLKEKDCDMNSMYMRYLPEISMRQYLFNRNEILLEHINRVSKIDLLAFAKQFITKINRIDFVV